MTNNNKGKVMNSRTRINVPELSEITDMMDVHQKASPYTVDVYNEFISEMRDYAKDEVSFQTSSFDFFEKSWRHSAQQNDINFKNSMSNFDFCSQVYCAYYGKQFYKEINSEIQKGFWKKTSSGESESAIDGKPRQKMKM